MGALSHQSEIQDALKRGDPAVVLKNKDDTFFCYVDFGRKTATFPDASVQALMRVHWAVTTKDLGMVEYQYFVLVDEIETAFTNFWRGGPDVVQFQMDER